MLVLKGLSVLLLLINLTRSQQIYHILITWPPPVNLSSAETIFNSFLRKPTTQDICYKNKVYKLYTISDVNWTSSLQDFKNAQTQFTSKSTILKIGAPTFLGTVLKSELQSISSIVMEMYPSETPLLSSFYTPNAVTISLASKMLETIQSSSPIARNEPSLFILSPDEAAIQSPWKNANPIPRLADSVQGFIWFFPYANDPYAAMNLIQRYNIINIIVILPGRGLEKVLVAAKDRNLLYWKYRWIIINLTGQSNLNDRTKYNMESTNITTFEYGLTTVAEPQLSSSDDIMMYDMFHATSKYLHYIFCNGEYTEYLDKTINGLAGQVRVFHDGQYILSTRNTYSIKVSHHLGQHKKMVGHVTLSENGTIAHWSVPAPLIKQNNRDVQLRDAQKRTMHILTFIEPPFVTYKANHHRYSNLNDKLEGFGIEIVNKILQQLNISYNYHFYTGPDSFGTQLSDGSWNGMLGDLFGGRTDMVVLDYTVTAHRSNAFDFLKNIHTFTYTVLLPAAENDLYDLFDFLYPLTWEVWVVTISCTIGVAIVLAIMHHISPNYDNVKFTFYESIFFTIGSLFHGVTVTPPNRPSGRLVACMWWLFTLVTVIIYIANYGAMRTKEVSTEKIVTLADLYRQSEYQYGVVKGNSIDQRFGEANEEIMSKMAVMMKSHFTSGRVSTFDELLSKVRAGKQAIITTSYIAKYYAYHECLRTTASFDFYELGFPLQKDSQYTTLFNEQVDILRKNGYIEGLQLKYWPNGTSQKCRDNRDILEEISDYLTQNINVQNNESPYAMNLRLMMGIFAIMVLGCVVSVIFAVFEFAFRQTCQKMFERKRRKRNRQHRPGDRRRTTSI